jgi:transcriptional regulator of acetoin/glycerol metabolism
MIDHCGRGILVTDAEGLVLDARARAADAEVLRSWGLASGVDWSEAARALGLGRATLYLRMKRLGIDERA